MNLSRFNRSASKPAWAAIVVVVIIVIAAAGYMALSSGTQQTTTSSIPTSTSKSISTTQAISPIKLTVSTAVRASPDYFLPILIGQQQGIFLKHGLDVTWTPFSGGGPMYQAVAAGSAPIGLSTPIDVIIQRANHVPMRTLGLYMPANAFEIFVNYNSTIKSLKQLNDTTVGVSALGGLQQFYFQLISKQNNLTLKYVGAGGLTQMVALLKTGKISAFVYTTPSVLGLIDQKEIRSISKVVDAEPKDWQDGEGIYATDQFIQQNPEAVRRWVAGFLDSVQFVVNNPQVAVQVYVKETNSTQAVAQEAIAYFQNIWTPSGKFSVAGLQSMETFLANYGFLKGTPAPLSDLYNDSFLP